MGVSGVKLLAEPLPLLFNFNSPHDNRRALMALFFIMSSVAMCGATVEPELLEMKSENEAAVSICCT